MITNDFGSMRRKSVEGLRDDLESIRPGLSSANQDPDRWLENPPEFHSGEIRQILSAQGKTHPTTDKINAALGFLAYNDVLEAGDSTINTYSSSQTNRFELGPYTESRYTAIIGYLDQKTEEYSELNRNTEIELDDFNPEKYVKI
ncbi:MAG: hypothetical protein ABEK16_04925 [Candidatus Nanohalobium sp.]